MVTRSPELARSISCARIKFACASDWLRLYRVDIWHGEVSIYTTMSGRGKYKFLEIEVTLLP